MKIRDMDKLDKWYGGKYLEANKILYFTRKEDGKAYPVADYSCSCCEEPRFQNKSIDNIEAFEAEVKDKMTSERIEMTYHEDIGYCCKYCFCNRKHCKNGCKVLAVVHGLCRKCYMNEQVQPSIDSFVYADNGVEEFEVNEKIRD